MQLKTLLYLDKNDPQGHRNTLTTPCGSFLSAWKLCFTKAVMQMTLLCVLYLQPASFPKWSLRIFSPVKSRLPDSIFIIIPHFFEKKAWQISKNLRQSRLIIWSEPMNCFVTRISSSVQTQATSCMQRSYLLDYHISKCSLNHDKSMSSSIIFASGNTILI